MMIRSAAIAVFVLAVGSSAHAQQQPVTRPIGSQTHVISSHPDGNILVIETSNSVVLVDAVGARRAAAADSALRTITRKPVSTVISTHYHEDHTGGNAIWAARGARVVGHRNVPIEGAKDTTIAERRWHRKPVPKEALPTTLFEDSFRIDVDGISINVLHLNAHTNGDAIVWVPQRNVLHTGDIVEIGAPPFIDWWAGGSLDGMIAAVDFFLGLSNDSTVIVPGHGPPIDRAMLKSYRMLLMAAGIACNAGRADVPNFACRPARQAAPVSN